MRKGKLSLIALFWDLLLVKACQTVYIVKVFSGSFECCHRVSIVDADVNNLLVVDIVGLRFRSHSSEQDAFFELPYPCKCRGEYILCHGFYHL